ncbi:hypothetical protein MAFF211520_04730 [Ralstonia pseudosolanacearum]|nr:hypothetical protein MAFF211479_04320 [Ralstonia solanacearum]BEU50181.1 hypothetical protein MAFF211520_04730 [Ralstonia pseudosolanacearum]BCL95927.1 hypothetical protein MAFF211491_03790 [Ralstonia solanacearum]BCM06001.1 hypothetical protein MAFF241647_03580 [Ralstonia solanacearum]BCM11241.1 hypothetical protein MAFF241648_04310 [Ralstonia solanacearum]
MHAPQQGEQSIRAGGFADHFEALDAADEMPHGGHHAGMIVCDRESDGGLHVEKSPERTERAATHLPLDRASIAQPVRSAYRKTLIRADGT